METWLDGANPRLYFSTSSAFTRHSWHHASFAVAQLLYKLQVADAANCDHLQVVFFLAARAADLCHALDHQIRSACLCSPDYKDCRSSSSGERAMGLGVSGGCAGAYGLLPALFSVQVVATNLEAILVHNMQLIALEFCSMVKAVKKVFHFNP
ncbi:hypothetical protein CJ030_MR8G002781 [Morella rubra]|uniref:Uncharacterized protein n=1 Tax=Morella rubra TaxID=262757 RepID=A0A6A1UX49_9ROSI|nr:hypothetical protein CJ030_MR8G002784 [Morella rubra]KAB1203653.1 hypothetical protein CJ030_MR8G002781 [Morella rubra]